MLAYAIADIAVVLHAAAGRLRHAPASLDDRPAARPDRAGLSGRQCRVAVSPRPTLARRSMKVLPLSLAERRRMAGLATVVLAAPFVLLIAASVALGCIVIESLHSQPVLQGLRFAVAPDDQRPCCFPNRSVPSLFARVLRRYGDRRRNFKEQFPMSGLRRRS
ncbi:MAG: hypothetical protein E5X48_32320 [Mesorhizobium sp.]|nr:MAG: hypothetical protein E5X48_32320 [Mesorhizobium sp.]